MRNPRYIIRNYQPQDFDEYVRLSVEAERLEPSGRGVSPQQLAEHLGRPSYSPEQDLFVVDIAGKIISYLDVAPELDTGVVILDCWVHPKHRRKGLATKLVDCAIHRAKELGAAAARVNIAEDNSVAQSVLSRLGFEYVRQFLELRLDMAEIHWQDIDQTALEYCHLQSGEEDKLTQIQNRSFTGTWGFNPNTLEEITYRTNLSNCSLEDVILARDGDRVIGYCWTVVTYESPTGERKGRISMIGTDPDYRGEGVGKGVLLAGLAYLKGKGLRVVDLTVNSENKVACALYWSVGFRLWTRSLWYEKSVN